MTNSRVRTAGLVLALLIVMAGVGSARGDEEIEPIADEFDAQFFVGSFDDAVAHYVALRDNTDPESRRAAAKALVRQACSVASYFIRESILEMVHASVLESPPSWANVKEKPDGSRVIHLTPEEFDEFAELHIEIFREIYPPISDDTVVWLKAAIFGIWNRNPDSEVSVPEEGKTWVTGEQISSLYGEGCENISGVDISDPIAFAEEIVLPFLAGSAVIVVDVVPRIPALPALSVSFGGQLVHRAITRLRNWIEDLRPQNSA